MLLYRGNTWTCSICSYVKQELGHAVYVSCKASACYVVYIIYKASM